MSTSRRFGLTADPSVAAWCTARDHPIITYNPWFDISLCRCAELQIDGRVPWTEASWRAVHDLFHTCRYEDHCKDCSCYTQPSWARA